MAERILPGLDLWGFWDLGADGWKDKNDLNLRILSAWGLAVVKGVVNNLPANPANGDIYLVLQGSNAGTMAVRDNASWVYLTAKPGAKVFDLETMRDWQFLGGVWNKLSAAGSGVRPGTVISFVGTTPPEGFLELDGTTLGRADYPELFTHLSDDQLLITQGSKEANEFGTGDGSSTFTLADWRGEFIRGWDHGRGIDPGRGMSKFQAQSFESHSHAQPWYTTAVSTGERYIGLVGYGRGLGGSGGTYAAGGSETRPRNVSAMFCIKY